MVRDRGSNVQLFAMQGSFMGIFTISLGQQRNRLPSGNILESGVEIYPCRRFRNGQ
jgi:hypothetical protein